MRRPGCARAEAERGLSIGQHDQRIAQILHALLGQKPQLPREVLRQAFAAGLLQDGQLWIDMLDQRNLMAHTDDVRRARIALALIGEHFAPALGALAMDLQRRP